MITQRTLSSRMSLLVVKPFVAIVLIFLALFFGFSISLRNSLETTSCLNLSKVTELLSYQVGRELAIRNQGVAETILSSFRRELMAVSPLKMAELSVEASKDVVSDPWVCQLHGTDLHFTRSVQFGDERLGLIRGRIQLFDAVLLFLPMLLIIATGGLGCVAIAKHFFEAAEKEIILPIGRLAASNFGESFEEFAPEIQDIRNKLAESHRMLLEKERQELDLKAKVELANLARQVVHDIRSPISALNMLAAASRSIEADQRALLIGATKRINGICSLLLEKFKGVEEVIPANPRNRVQDAKALLTQLIAEKQVQYGDLNLQFNLNCTIAHSEVEIDEVEIGRVFSNLIDNAVEACEPDIGVIEISVGSDENGVSFTIADNGKGIDADILPKLGHAGATFGKSGSARGNGLGLFHAKVTTEKAGGTLQIRSRLGEGTKIKITLPHV